MFSTKMFNKFTMILATLFFLSAIISTLTDIQNDANVRLEFKRLMQDVTLFNNSHNNTINPVIPSDVEDMIFKTGKQALVESYKNYEEASSYYMEASGRLSTVTFGFPLEVDIFINSTQYENGDFVQEAIAREVGTLFGGKKGALMAYYNAKDNVVYRNFTWRVNPSDVGDRLVGVYSKNNWVTQSLQSYVMELGDVPGTPLYDINSRTAVKELWFTTSKNSNNQVTDYYVQFSLNAPLSTRMYNNFLKYTLNIVSEDFVKSISFKDITVYSIIGADGNIKSLRFKEKYNFTVSAPMGGVRVTVNSSCTAEMSYMFSYVNQPIPFARPSVPKK